MQTTLDRTVRAVRRRASALLAAAAVALTAGLLSAQARPPAPSPAPLDSATTRAIDDYVTSRMKSTRMPGVAVVVVVGDRIAYLKAYGRADPSGGPVTPQTPFLIGSITKTFTALAVMQQVEAGRIDLDAPVQRYLPWFRVGDSATSSGITVRHLLTMTSGVPQLYEPQQWTDTDDQATERAVRLLAASQLTGSPGRTFGYSNANYEALALVVRAVTGQTYEDYVRQRIFTPLGMRNSYVSQDEAQRHGMASGHRWVFGFPVAVTVPFNRAELPAGYIIASAEDMAHYLVAQMNEGRYRETRVLSPRLMALHHAEPPPGMYGMGWESVRRDGHRLINHDGGTTNSQASLFFDPDSRIGVFLAANVINAIDAFASPSGSSPLDGQTTRAMAGAVLSLATHRPLPDQRPGHELLTFALNVTIVGLTALFAWSVVRLWRRFRGIVLDDLARTSGFRRRAAVGAVVGLAMAILVLYLALDSALWQTIAAFQPDFAGWAYVMAAGLALKAALELWLVLHGVQVGGAHLQSRGRTGRV